MATPHDPSSPGRSGMPEFEWHPADLLRPRLSPRIPADTPGAAPDESDENGHIRFALVVLNQPFHTHLGMVRQLWDNACARVAADGGANSLYQAAGAHGDPCFDDLDTIIGDLDSLNPETRHYYESLSSTSSSTPTSASPRRIKATQILHVPEQESTDFAKAVSHVRQHDLQETQQQNQLNQQPPSPKPLDIVALGGLGGRVDQGVSQLHHLFLFQAGDPAYELGRVFLFSGESLTWLLKPGLHRIRVRRGRRAAPTDPENDKNGSSPLGSARASLNTALPPAPPANSHPDGTGPPRAPNLAGSAEGPLPGRDRGAHQGYPGEENGGNGDVFGKHVGILPVGGPSVITTRGLEWDVREWRTEFGGRVSTSNHVLPETEVVEVETTREVLFTIALRGVEGSG